MGDANTETSRDALAEQIAGGFIKKVEAKISLSADERQALHDMKPDISRAMGKAIEKDPSLATMEPSTERDKKIAEAVTQEMLPNGKPSPKYENTTAAFDKLMPRKPLLIPESTVQQAARNLAKETIVETLQNPENRESVQAALAGGRSAGQVATAAGAMEAADGAAPADNERPGRNGQASERDSEDPQRGVVAEGFEVLKKAIKLFAATAQPIVGMVRDGIESIAGIMPGSNSPTNASLNADGVIPDRSQSASTPAGRTNVLGEMDRDGDGVVSRQEFKSALKQDGRRDQLVATLDADRNGKISGSEMRDALTASGLNVDDARIGGMPSAVKELGNMLIASGVTFAGGEGIIRPGTTPETPLVAAARSGGHSIG